MQDSNTMQLVIDFTSLGSQNTLYSAKITQIGKKPLCQLDVLAITKHTFFDGMQHFI